jgi:ABC-type glycerol-3-phosphate transport system substrate-binding protein
MKRQDFLKAAGQSAAAAALLPAAATLDPAGALAAPAKAGQTTVTFWEFNTDTPSLTIWRKVIAGFEAKNPDVKINMQIVPWSEQAQKLTTAVGTGSAPDVSMMGNDVVAQYAAIGALAPLDHYFDAWSTSVGHNITADFYPGDHLYYNYKGHWYASPLCEETRLIYYRKSLFQQAGLDPNKPPLTFQQMLQAAQKLNQPSKGLYGWGIPGGINYGTVQTFMVVYLAYGARFLNAQGLCGFDTPEFRAALQYYTDLYTKYKVTPPDTTTNINLESEYEAGKLAMVIDGPWLWVQMADGAVKNDTVLAQLPRGPKMRAAFLGGWPLVMWAQSKVKDATFRFIKYVTDPAQAMSSFCYGAGQLPGRKSLAVKAPWTAMPNQIFINQLNFAYPYQYPYREIPQMGSLEVSAVQTAVQNVMLGRATVDQATKDLVTHINAVLQP